LTTEKIKMTSATHTGPIYSRTTDFYLKTTAKTVPIDRPYVI
jgi:hypothetical protein